MLQIGDRVLSALPGEGPRKGTVQGVLAGAPFPYRVQWDDEQWSVCSAASLAPCDPALPSDAQAAPMTVGQLIERLLVLNALDMPVALRLGVTDDHGHSEHQCADLTINYYVEDGAGVLVIEGELSL